MSTPEDRDELTHDELGQEGEGQLPDREATSVINANLASPVNAQVAANVSDNSFGVANPEQVANIDEPT